MLMLVKDNRITGKVCARCGEEKRVHPDPKKSDFYYRAFPDKRQQGRYESWCNDCRSNYGKEYRKQNRDRLLVLQKDCRQRKIDHYRAVNRRWYQRKERTG
jgi:hypothetical protein